MIKNGGDDENLVRVQIQGNVLIRFGRSQNEKEESLHHQEGRTHCGNRAREYKRKKVPLKGCVTFIGDIVSPVAEDEWEVQK